MIKAWKQKKNALLESPTGTGKTLALLWAVLAWLRSENEVKPDEFRSISRVIYCSRTHSQLNQVINELKYTAYQPKMILIGSRDQLWVNEKLKELRGIALNTQCKKAIQKEDEINGCIYHRNLINQKNTDHISFDTFDIEDLHKIGEEEKICPYYLQKQRAPNADLVLMPYNYVIDPQIRPNFEVNFENSIIIFDEAHNIGKVSEDVASFELSINQIRSTIGELNILCKKLLTAQLTTDTVYASKIEEVDYFKRAISGIRDRIIKFNFESSDRLKAGKF